MKLSYVLVLLMLSVMPVLAGQSLKLTKQGDYLDSNARYRSTRHHYGHRSHTRRISRPSIYEPTRTNLPAPAVAETNLEPFDWEDYQPPVRWGDVDISAVLKPNDFVNFPPDPAPFKLPPDPPIAKGYFPQEDWVLRRTFYIFALLIMAVLCTGAAREIAMFKTCHKHISQRGDRLAIASRQLSLKGRGYWKALFNLT